MELRPAGIESPGAAGSVGSPASARTPAGRPPEAEPKPVADGYLPTAPAAPAEPLASEALAPEAPAALQPVPAGPVLPTVPDVLPELVDPHIEEKPPAPAPTGVPLQEALRQAATTPLPAPAPAMEVPEVKVGGPVTPRQPAQAAPLAKPAPAVQAQAAPEAEAPRLSKTVLATTIRALRRVENALLSIVGRGDPVLDLEPELTRINTLGAEMAKLSDAELKGKTAEFKKRLEAGETLDDLRVEAYAVAREAASRATGMKPYDVQVIGALAMGQNKIAEMKTGEGKTLTEVMPVYLNALAGKGVHVVTVNETLAERDCHWMGPVFEALGLKVGLVKEEMTPEQRRAGYQADVTYLTNTSLGFDYLRDQTAMTPQERVQRPPFFALVDEVDEVLIDEARTPLIISSRDKPAEGEYRRFAQIVAGLTPGEHFQVNRKKHQAWLTEKGLDEVEKQVGTDNLYGEQHLHLVPYLQRALQARGLYVKDRDYIVEDGKLMIVDEFTGRVLEDRRYNDGLHQALEAREGLEIQPEQRTLASITYPNLFRRYPRVAGMSGTAKTEESEFLELYGLEVVPVPTHKPLARKDEDDVVFRTLDEKFKAIVDKTDELFQKGQPVLIGTRSIQVNEYLSALLAQRGIPHQVLNAKSVKDNTDAENAVIAEAGRSGMVTLATNMAGRGVDIKPDKVNFKKLAIEVSNRVAAGEAVVVDLGKPSEAEQLGAWLAMGQIPHATVTAASAAPAAGTVQVRLGVAEPAPAGVTALKGEDFTTGGLFVLGTERHESRRIDDQLRGRSGRQGAPGGSRFYISLEDDLMRHFGGPKLGTVLDRLGVPKGQGLTDPMVAKLIRAAQEKVEQHHYSIRKDTTKYDQVLNKHREVFYGDRNAIVDGENLRERMLDWGSEWLAMEILKDRDSEKKIKPEELSTLVHQAAERLGLPLPEPKVSGKVKPDDLADLLRPELESRYAVIEQHFGASTVREQERWSTLHAMDAAWMNHLENMEHMQQGIGLVAYGEKDPWQAYQERAYELFRDMVVDTRTQVGQELFGAVLREVPDPAAAAVAGKPAAKAAATPA